MTTSTRYRCASIDIGVINLAFCVIDFTEACDGTFSFDLVHAERACIGSVDQTIHALGKKLLLFYSTRDVLKAEKLDYVFIEQQLSRAVKNIVLAHVTMAYFETKCLDGDNTRIVFVPPKKKFKAVTHAFSEDVFDSIKLDCSGRELKSLSVKIASAIFTRFRVKVGLDSLAKYKTKPDDICDVFLQSFSFFLERFPPTSRGPGGLCSLIRVKEDRQCEDANKETH